MTDNADQPGAREQLETLRAMLSDAKSVPMSASCMVNRSEALAAVDAALASLPDELTRAQEVLDAREDEVAKGRAEAERMKSEADAYAKSATSQTSVVTRAQEEADRILAEARAEAEGLRQEADSYVERHFAEFEAGLAKTAAQVRTIRSKLVARAPQE